MESATPETPADGAQRQAKWARGALAVLIGGFVAFAAFAVPRLTNSAVGDLEFTGWSGPIGSRIARGEVPYVDFVLPIPPGSLALLAGIEKLTGRAALINELGLIAVTQLAMALLGYVIVRPFARRDTAVLVSCASLMMLLRAPKECAYDYTAELCAWASVAAGSYALTLSATRRRQLAFGLAGFFAALTASFKQSTAMGAVLGWAGALAYAALWAVTTRRRDPLATLARGGAAMAGGAALGVLSLVLLLSALGSSFGAYVQAVFADAPSLKGGSVSLAANLASHLIGSPAYPASLVLTLAAAAVLVRLAGSPAGLNVARPDAVAATSAKTWLFVMGSVCAVLLGATLLITSSRTGLPPLVLFWADRLRFLPGFGLLVACFAFVAQLGKQEPPDDASQLPRETAFNALLLVALTVSLLHNLSSPEFRPFYDPNPIIPLAFYCLFRAFERAGLPRLRLAVFVLALGALFSPKLDRALAARLPIGRHGHWAGLYVSESAMPTLRAALRARELAAETETVVVLPEDVQLAALIGRPRPPIKGAIVFVDQYAGRLLAADLRTLEQHLPKVVIIRPAERETWIRMFALWNNQSAARKVTERFLDDWLPKHYVLDSSYPTRFGTLNQTLQVWVKKP